MAIHCWLRFCIGNSLFGALKLTTNPDSDKCKCDIGFDAHFKKLNNFLLSSGSGFCKNIIGVDQRSPVHVDNRKRYPNTW